MTDQYVYFVAVDATDFTTRETALSSFTVYRSRNGGTATAMTTPTINETSSANMPGVYELLLDEDMTIDAGDDEQEMVFHITHSGMAPVTRAITLFRRAVTAGRTLSIETDGDLTKVNALDGHTAQTGDSFARLGAPAGASVSADIAAVESHTDDIGVAGAGLTAIPWNSAWDAEVQSEAADALVAYDPPTKAELDSGFAGLNDLSAATVNAEVDSALADIHLDHIFATDYDPAAKPGVGTALLNELVESDAGVPRFTVNALENGPSGSGASAEAIADAVLDEALSGHATAGSLGKAVADIEADTAQVGVAGAGLSAIPWNPSWDTEVQSEAADALTAYDPPTKAELDSGLAALNDLSAADVNAQMDAAFTTQMADSVAADGSIPTREQALLMVSRFLFERSVASTTVTVTKEDGSTSSMTFALDDAANPTSITRSG